MIELLKILLSLSLSGTLLILVLTLCKPLYKNRLSRQWQYYIWLIVLARLLIPFTPETSLVGNLFREVDSAIVQISTSGPTDSSLSPETDFAEHDTPSYKQADIPTKESPKLEKTLVQSVSETAAQNIWLICVLVWLMVAVGLLIRKVTIYQNFVKYINAGRMEVIDMRLWEQLGRLVEQAGVKRTVELYTNSIISSPLLIGFLHPCIMLPSAELSDSDLKNTILHELTHYKRRDMFYKWLVQIAICFHWFNPFVYLMGKEINRACEFSCDEVVIRTFDKGEQRAYGDTLLNAIEAGGNYNDSVASVMLNENAELLKERLDAIMRFKKSTRLTAAISIALVFALCFGATAAGAYMKPDSKTQANPINTRPNATNVEIDIDQLNQSEQISYGPYSLKAGTAWGVNLSWNGNGMISVGCKSNVKYAGEQLLQQVESPISHEFIIQEDGVYTFTITNQYAVSQEYKLEPFITNLTGLIYMGDKPSEGLFQQSKSGNSGEKTFSTMPAIQSADNVTVSFSGVSVTGQGPVGVELVKSQNSDVTFELLNMDKENTCTTDASIVDGIMQITVNNDVPNGINVDFGPEHKNIVRVYIPDALYTQFDIQTTEMVVQMQDFNAPVHVESNRAGFWLIDNIISQGTYDINVLSGPIYIEANTILKDITANAVSGPLTVRFNKVPTNLYLDTTNCGPSVERPDDWSAIYKIGNETPKIILSNNGKATVEVQNSPITDK